MVEPAPSQAARASAINPTWVLYMLSVAGLLVNSDARALAPVLPAIAASFGASIAQAGLLVTAYALPYGLCQVLYGPLADRYGKVRIVAISTTVFGLGAVGCSLGGSLAHLVGLRALTGAFAAGIVPISLAYIGDAFPYRERQPAVATYLGLTALGQSFGMAFGGLIADVLNWRWVFATYGALGLAVAAAIARLPREPRASGDHAGTSVVARYRQALTTPAGLRVNLATISEGALTYGALTYLGAYARDRFGLSYLGAGLVLGVFGLFVMVGSHVVRRWARRLGERAMLMSGLVAMALAYGLGSLAPAWPLLAGALALLGAGFSFAHSTLQTLATEVLPEARGTAVTVFAFCLYSGTGLGSALFSLLVARAGAASVLPAAAAGLVIFALSAMAAFPGQRAAAVHPGSPTQPASIHRADSTSPSTAED